MRLDDKQRIALFDRDDIQEILRDVMRALDNIGKGTGRMGQSKAP